MKNLENGLLLLQRETKIAVRKPICGKIVISAAERYQYAVAMFEFHFDLNWIHATLNYIYVHLTCFSVPSLKNHPNIKGNLHWVNDKIGSEDFKIPTRPFSLFIREIWIFVRAAKRKTRKIQRASKENKKYYFHFGREKENT